MFWEIVRNLGVENSISDHDDGVCPPKIQVRLPMTVGKDICRRFALRESMHEGDSAFREGELDRNVR